MYKYKFSKILRQRPVRGGRESLPSCVLKSIMRAVEKDAMHYGVSKSFVIATILAKAYGIEEQEDFHSIRQERKVS